MPDTGNPAAWNRYEYSGNNPVRYRDPTGHWPESPIDFIFIVVDVAFLAADAINIAENGYSPEAGQEVAIDAVALVVDLACAATPGATGGRLAVELVSAGGDISKAMAHLVARTSYLGEKLGIKGLQFFSKSPASKGNKPQVPKFAASNFRKNLEKRTPKPADMKNPQAHHMLPQALEDRFKKLGIDIHDPKWGAWVEGSPEGGHQRWTDSYESDWAQWLRENPNATLADVEKQARTLAENYGIGWK